MRIIEYIARHGNYTIAVSMYTSSVPASNVGVWWLGVTYDLSYCIMTRKSLTQEQINIINFQLIFTITRKTKNRKIVFHSLQHMRNFFGSGIKMSEWGLATYN